MRSLKQTDILTGSIPKQLLLFFLPIWFGTLFQQLRDRGVLVRYFNKPRIHEFLRITIGTPEEMDVLIHALEEVLEVYQ